MSTTDTSARCSMCGAGPNEFHDEFQHHLVQTGYYDNWSDERVYRNGHSDNQSLDGESLAEMLAIGAEADARLKRDLAKQNYLNIHTKRKKRR